jgi:hypothetical protein
VEKVVTYFRILSNCEGESYCYIGTVPDSQISSGLLRHPQGFSPDNGGRMFL